MTKPDDYSISTVFDVDTDNHVATINGIPQVGDWIEVWLGNGQACENWHVVRVVWRANGFDGSRPHSNGGPMVIARREGTELFPVGEGWTQKLHDDITGMIADWDQRTHPESRDFLFSLVMAIMKRVAKALDERV